LLGTLFAVWVTASGFVTATGMTPDGWIMLTWIMLGALLWWRVGRER
jgi:hypothetical protein